jgi:hypothetical protein
MRLSSFSSNSSNISCYSTLYFQDATGTIFEWTNPSPGTWARGLFVVQAGQFTWCALASRIAPETPTTYIRTYYTLNRGGIAEWCWNSTNGNWTQTSVLNPVNSDTKCAAVQWSGANRVQIRAFAQDGSNGTAVSMFANESGQWQRTNYVPPLA